MNFMNFGPSGTPAIGSDRELLAELGMSDAAAAAAIDKTRQALNLKLGPQRSSAADPPRRPYFKPTDLLLLIMSAQDSDHSFDEHAVWQFIEESAPYRSGGSEETYRRIQSQLGLEEIDLEGAGTVVMILPAFADMRAALPGFSMDLARVAERLARQRPAPWLAVLSSSNLQARMAADWLRLPAHRTGCATHEFVDHYLPTVLVFPRTGEDPRSYALNERNNLGAAPQFRASVIGEFVKFMLPEVERTRLFSYEDESDNPEGEHPGSTTKAPVDDKVTPRRRQSG